MLDEVAIARMKLIKAYKVGLRRRKRRLRRAISSRATAEDECMQMGVEVLEVKREGVEVRVKLRRTWI